ncbi:11105_t:CDS:2 [Acaulospora morrowiae]|uniref:11105_t:CDS:1 n=1 Tax=Acaulospora morrowiae TaxID=94023 RepID=A0A9N8V7Y7_9GLOM|nr:11105_t:CDS:2 [Acaulospora morrowiae]
MNPFGHGFGPVSTKMWGAFVKNQSARGLDNNITNRLRSLLEQNRQLEDIHEEKNMMRYKTEDVKLGKAAVSNTMYGFYSMKSILTPIIGATSEEYDKMIDVFGKELEDNDSYLDLSRVYGRKKENI